MDDAKPKSLYKTEKWIYISHFSCRKTWREIRRFVQWCAFDFSLVQILVVVASTKIKIFWAEVEKGLTWTEIVRELVDPKEFVKHNLKGQRILEIACKGCQRFESAFFWKGIRLIFLNHSLDETSLGGNTN